MKTLSILAALFCFATTSMAFADAVSIKITSFVVVGGNGSTVADLCAKVTPAPAGPTAVQVVVDPGHKTEAHYNTMVGSDGQFCMMVTTYYGRAEASVLK